LPKVSVVIPTYNSAPYIAKTLESVFVQTYKDYEVIIVDDGSTDDTREVLKPFLHRIRYIYQDNRGPAAARNMGIRLAEGEYIAFLDSDDRWLPEKLRLQVEHLTSNPEVGLVYTDIGIIESGPRAVNYAKVRKHSGFVFWELLGTNFIPTTTVMVRRECFEKLGPLDESPIVQGAEDYDVWLRIARHYKIGYIPIKLAEHRCRSDSHSRNIDRKYRSLLYVVERTFDNILNNVDKNVQRLRRRYLSNILFYYGYTHFDCGNLRQARKPLSSAIKYRFLNLKAIGYYLVTFLGRREVLLLRRIKRKTLKAFGRR